MRFAARWRTFFQIVQLKKIDVFRRKRNNRVLQILILKHGFRHKCVQRFFLVGPDGSASLDWTNAFPSYPEPQHIWKANYFVTLPPLPAPLLAVPFLNVSAVWSDNCFQCQLIESPDRSAHHGIRFPYGRSYWFVRPWCDHQLLQGDFQPMWWEIINIVMSLPSRFFIFLHSPVWPFPSLPFTCPYCRKFDSQGNLIPKFHLITSQHFKRNFWTFLACTARDCSGAHATSNRAM